MIKLVGQKYGLGMPMGHSDEYTFFISKKRDDFSDDYYSVTYTPRRTIQHINEGIDETLDWMTEEQLNNFKLELIYNEGDL